MSSRFTRASKAVRASVRLSPKRGKNDTFQTLSVGKKGILKRKDSWDPGRFVEGEKPPMPESIQQTLDAITMISDKIEAYEAKIAQMDRDQKDFESKVRSDMDERIEQLGLKGLDTLEAAQAENKQIEQMLQKEEKSLEESAVIMLGTIETLTQYNDMVPERRKQLVQAKDEFKRMLLQQQQSCKIAFTRAREVLGQLEELKLEHLQVNKMLVAERDKCDEFERQVKKMTRALAEAESKMREEVNHLQKELDRREEDLQESEERSAQFEQLAHKNAEELAFVTKERDRQAIQITRLEKDLEVERQLQNKLRDKMAADDVIKKRFDEQQAKLDRLQKQEDGWQAEMNRLQRTADEALKEARARVLEMDVLRESWDEERGELEAVIDAKEEMVAQLKESLQMCEEQLNKQNELIEKDIADRETETKSLKASVKQLQTAYKGTMDKFNLERKKAAELDAKLKTIKAAATKQIGALKTQLQTAQENERILKNMIQMINNQEEYVPPPSVQPPPSIDGHYMNSAGEFVSGSVPSTAQSKNSQGISVNMPDSSSGSAGPDSTASRTKFALSPQQQQFLMALDSADRGAQHPDWNEVDLDHLEEQVEVHIGADVFEVDHEDQGLLLIPTDPPEIVSPEGVASALSKKPHGGPTVKPLAGSTGGPSSSPNPSVKAASVLVSNIRHPPGSKKSPSASPRTVSSGPKHASQQRRPSQNMNWDAAHLSSPQQSGSAAHLHMDLDGDENVDGAVWPPSNAAAEEMWSEGEDAVDDFDQSSQPMSKLQRTPRSGLLNLGKSFLVGANDTMKSTLSKTNATMFESGGYPIDDVSSSAFSSDDEKEYFPMPKKEKAQMFKDKLKEYRKKCKVIKAQRGSLEEQLDLLKKTLFFAKRRLAEAGLASLFPKSLHRDQGVQCGSAAVYLAPVRTKMVLTAAGHAGGPMQIVSNIRLRKLATRQGDTGFPEPKGPIHHVPKWPLPAQSPSPIFGKSPSPVFGRLPLAEQAPVSLKIMSMK